MALRQIFVNLKRIDNISDNKKIESKREREREREIFLSQQCLATLSEIHHDNFQEEKKSLKERLQAIQEVTQTVQNSIGYIASLCERVKNLFNFTIPYLSCLAMILAIVGAVVLYFIPVRYLILAWGVNKFSRKIFRPHSVPNNEILDLISRVPDDEELLNYR